MLRSLSCLTAFMFAATTLADADNTSSDPLAELTPIAASKGTVEVGATALVIAHAISPAIQVEDYEKRLDALAVELKPALAGAGDSVAKLAVMTQYVYKRWNFADRKALPADVFVSFVDVLDKRQWNCFALSVLFVALGERVGIPIELVSGRAHVCVKLSGKEMYIETTDTGRVYTGKEYLASYLPFPCVDPNDYKAVTAREAIAVLLTQTGGAVLAQGKSELALSCFKHALLFDPRHAEAHAALGFLYAQTGAIDRAMDSFYAAIAADPKLREAYGGLGAALRANGDLKGAVEAMQKAVALCDKQPESIFNLGQMLYEAGDFSGSIDAYRKYTALVPGDPDGFVHLAFPLEDSGKLDDALAAYGDALRITPKLADALVNSGVILEKQGKWDAAKAMYAKCRGSAPNNALAYAGLGRVLTAQNQYNDAARAFDKSIELDAANAATWEDFAALEEKRGDVPAAIERMKRALQLEPNDPALHVVIAQLYLKNSEPDKAIDHVRKASELGAPIPDNLRSEL